MSRNNNAAYAPVPSDPSPPVLSLSEPQTWDSLRKTVKQLETELDAKLGGFSRLASASTTPYGGAGGSSATPQAEAAETDIDNVLKKLSTTIDAMSALLTPTSPPSSYHLVQRHRDLLFDNTREYRKIKANVIAAREQAELLSSVRNDISTHKNALSSGTDYYLSERNKIDSSHRMMDDAIDQAYATREDLDRQRSSLAGAHRRMTGISAMFPQLNNLMTRIRVRRRRDTIILACVTAFCIILLFLYWRGG